MRGAALNARHRPMVLCLTQSSLLSDDSSVDGRPLLQDIKLHSSHFLFSLCPQKEFAAPPPLLFRKLSNPDLSPAATAATKSKLHRQLSQDESWGRRSSLAMTGNTHTHTKSQSGAVCGSPVTPELFHS